METGRSIAASVNGILTSQASKSVANFDGYALLNGQQKNSNGTHAVLNEQSARAILATSGLLKLDEEEDEGRMSQTYRPTMRSDQSVPPALAKRMLDAVLTGDLDVAHIQPYFSTFVNLIQSGQVELERHQAERLLHKVLVTSSSSTLHNEATSTALKRTRSRSHSRGKRQSVPK